ncbi:MAG TPA: M3 family metallopeptidase [Gemmatimonadaceae bacterium]|nr:M3 family metallopeptidase [Gemmatimonadaceae bacterium]
MAGTPVLSVGRARLTPDNPFAEPSPLPFGAPRFDRIRDEHYGPAIEEGIRRHLAEVDAIAHQAAAPTFENTIVALEQSGRLLSRVVKVFDAITSANTNEYLQEVQAETAPRRAAHYDAVYLDDTLFARVDTIYRQRAALGLTQEEHYLVERYHEEFVRAGARLSAADKTRLRALNEEESSLTTEFQNRLLAATKAGAVIIDDVSELDGLRDAEIAAAAEAARDRGLDARWVLALQNTTQQPMLQSLRRSDVRRRLFEASVHRADRAGEYDTRGLIARLAGLRAERAALLGYPSAAAHVLEDQMAKTPDAAAKLLSDVGRAAAAKARHEAEKIHEVVQRSGGDALEPWDWQYFAEQVRQAEYDLDESQIQPYFAVDRVLHDGVFYAAALLYGLAFKARNDIPVYHQDVCAFEVFDADGSSLALLYSDLFKRDNKSGGAWMDTFVDQSDLLGTKTVVFMVANFSKPAPGRQALLTFDEVTTMFHEFGHVLHGMLARVQYPLLAGTNVPRDFVEFPSQFNEHWALDPLVVANYARHYVTGEPMPAALIDRIKKARTFNQGFALTEYIKAAVIDMAWHTLPESGVPLDAARFETYALERSGLPLPAVPPRYHSTYFAHIWIGGYAAGYYAYLWAEVLDHDAYAWFLERGGLTRENGQRFRDMILSKGGTEEPAAMYRAFRGRDPRIDPLLAERGLEHAPTDF